MKRTLAVAVLLAVVSAVYGDTFSVYIHLIVDGPEETVVSSYIKRELRSLGDVELVDTDEAGAKAEWYLTIAVTEMKTTSGTVIGYTGVIAPLWRNIDSHVELLKFLFSDEAKKASEASTGEPYLWFVEVSERFKPLGAIIGKEADLRALCQRLIVEFDNALDHYR